MSLLVVGVDIGGTNIDVGVLEGQTGSILIQSSIPADVNTGPKNCCDRIVAEINRLLELKELSCSELTGIGLGVPGLVDGENGVLINSPNLPSSWDQYPLQSHLKGKFQVEVSIDNDANAATLAEGWIGAAQDVDNFLVLTLGTGIGGGIVQGGQLIRGTAGHAGELGHICIYPEGRACGCGCQGCVEAYGSATGIVAQFNELAKGSITVTSAKEVFDFARNNHVEAKIVLREAGKALGIACGTLLNVFNPDRIIIAGRMAASFDLLEEQVKLACQAHSFDCPFKQANILTSPLGASAGVIGAGALVAYHQKKSQFRTRPRTTTHETLKVLAAHIGVTGIRIGLVGIVDRDAYEILDQKPMRWPPPPSANKPDTTPEPHITPEIIAKYLTDYINGVDRSLSNNINAISLVTSGLVNRRDKKILESPHMPWRDIAIERQLLPRLQKLFQEKIYLERDAIAATLAERRFGQAKDINHFAVIYLGTGIGAGFVLNGQVYRGHREHAGEIGHTCVHLLGGDRCGCASKGCLECYASGDKLTKLVKKKISLGDTTILSSRKSDSLFYADILDAAKKKDTVAINALEEMGKNLGIGIRNLLLTLDLERVIISGPLAAGWQYYDQSTYEAIRKGLKMNEGWRTGNLVATALKGPEIAGAAASYLDQKV